MRHYISSFVFVLLIGNCCFSQQFPSSATYIVPGVYIGYTFGKGFNATIDCSVSFFDYTISENSSGYLGLNFSYAIFTHARKLYKNGFYRVVSVNMMNSLNDLCITKLGLAKTKLKWGLDDVNKSYSKGWGLNMDIAIIPFKYSPVIGFRYFKINNICMGIGATNPKFLYTGYLHPFYIR